MSNPSFLSSVLTGAGTAAGQGLVGTGIAALTGGLKGRPQWRDISFMNDVANRLTPDEAGRYNQYQDLTWGQDTQRQIDRIQGMGTELGMSPWELTGTAGAGTISPAPPMQDSSANKFLGAMAPQQGAALAAKTAIATAMIQSQTAKDVARIQTGDGGLPIQQTKTAASQENLNMAMEALTGAQNQAVRNSTLLATVEALFKTLPEQKITIGPYSVTSKKYFQGLQNIIANQSQAGAREGDREDIKNYLATIPPNEWQTFRQDLKTAIEETFDLGGDIVQKGYKFLESLAIDQ